MKLNRFSFSISQRVLNLILSLKRFKEWFTVFDIYPYFLGIDSKEKNAIQSALRRHMLKGYLIINHDLPKYYVYQGRASIEVTKKRITEKYKYKKGKPIRYKLICSNPEPWKYEHS